MALFLEGAGSEFPVNNFPFFLFAFPWIVFEFPRHGESYLQVLWGAHNREGENPFPGSESLRSVFQHGGWDAGTERAAD